MHYNQLAILTCDEFKVFLIKILREFNAFIAQIWGKMRENSQHQQEKI